MANGIQEPLNIDEFVKRGGFDETTSLEQVNSHGLMFF